jgi:tRNA 2-thiouridine synthesizing protein A
VAETIDARGLSCPLPAVKARRALATLGAGEELVVLATDPEAPLDLAALAADGGHAFAHVARPDGSHELRIVKAGRGR